MRMNCSEFAQTVGFGMVRMQSRPIGPKDQRFYARCGLAICALILFIIGLQ